MKNFQAHLLRSCCMGFALFLAANTACWAQFKTLVNFNTSNGAFPGYGAFVQGTDGGLYGTTQGGGAERGGTVFRITPNGILTTMYSFGAQNGTDGWAPYGGLLLGTDEAFYGTTFQGGPTNSTCLVGCGTVFKITQKGVLTTVYSFALTDGANPTGSLVQGADGDLYGTTEFGGNGTCVNLYTPGCGTIFKINSKFGFTSLYSFTGADGWNPHGGLVQGTDGNFYGTTAQGGAYSGGTVFKITPGGELTTLYNFCTISNCSDGQYPNAALIQASDATLYGTTAAGGSVCGFGSSGTFFKITTGGALTTLTTFCPSDASLIQGSDGNFYGTTVTGGFSRNSFCYAVFSAGCGTVFKIVPETNVLTIVHNFGDKDGDLPLAGVLEATTGSFYGTTSTGGPYAQGTIFRLSSTLGPFIAFIRPTGKVAQTAQILGQGLTGSTSVTFNGVPATSFSVVSDTYMTAVVPTGATTGPVVVTTPSGPLTSNVSFRISQ
jgi:uncharacterized repeat protein (TIGR03803 family)